MKVRTEINEIESKRKKERKKINETKAGSLRRPMLTECLTVEALFSHWDSAVNRTQKTQGQPSLEPLQII